jgi:predicted PurR-regulated permease PerM
LALVVALFDLIPVIGASIAAILVAIVTIFVDFPVALIVWAAFAVVYQQVENYLIQPQIQKRATKIEPFVVLVAVLFGSSLFGVVGALLAIPTAASIQIGLHEWVAYRREVEAEDEEPPSEPPSQVEPVTT